MKNLAQTALASLEVAISATTEAYVAPPPSGIRCLMVAVLEEAIQSLRSPESPVRDAAERWITSGERQYIFSFAVICETLDLEPIAVRGAVMGLLDKKKGSRRLIRRSRSNVRHTGAIYRM